MINFMIKFDKLFTMSQKRAKIISTVFLLLIMTMLLLQACVPTGYDQVTGEVIPVVDKVQMHEIEGYPVLCFTHGGSIDCVVLEGR